MWISTWIYMDLRLDSMRIISRQAVNFLKTGLTLQILIYPNYRMLDLYIFLYG